MSRKRIDLSALRSQRWFGAPGQPGNHKSYRTKQMGFTSEDFQGKPVIGILSTWSDLNSCHTHFPQRIEEIKRGVWQAGGFPVVMPTLSVGETYVRPSTLMYRNLLAMDVEEILRSHPIDGAVLLGGCDKTTPGLIMGAASMDIPAIFVPAGAMLRGHWRGQQLQGTGSSTWQALADYRAGRLDEKSWRQFGEGTARSPGTCNTMGTASTMTSLVDVLGLTLPGASSIPAVDATHSQMASLAGRRIVDMVWEDLRPAGLVTRAELRQCRRRRHGAVRLDQLAHPSHRHGAQARHRSHARRLRERERPGAGAVQPAAQRQVPDGGSLLRRRADGLAHAARGAPRSLLHDGERAHARREHRRRRGIQRRRHPHAGQPSLSRGRARGAAREPRAAGRGAQARRRRSPAAAAHADPPSCFATSATCWRASTIPTCRSPPTACWCCRTAGPIGAPGMPEWGMLPIPKKLLAAGVRDMVRISDARMSGTSYGTCVLHVCPESRVGGPLGLVRDGDLITLDTAGPQLELLVDAKRARQTPKGVDRAAAALRARFRCAAHRARSSG